MVDKTVDAEYQKGNPVEDNINTVISADNPSTSEHVHESRPIERHPSEVLVPPCKKFSLFIDFIKVL